MGRLTIEVRGSISEGKEVTQLAYLFATGLGGIIWAVLFLLRSDLRRVMVAISLAGLPLAVSDLFYVPQYWRPHTLGHIPIGIEGLLFSFEAAGICAVIYPAVFRKGFEPAGLPSGVDPEALPRLLVPVLPLPVSAIIAVGLHTNLEWGLYAGLILASVATAWIRRDLLVPQLLGGLAFMPIYALALAVWVAAFPSVHDWFTLWRMPHWYLLRVPLTEVIFGGLFATFWTGVYPMLFERRFVPLKARGEAPAKTWISARGEPRSTS